MSMLVGQEVHLEHSARMRIERLDEEFVFPKIVKKILYQVSFFLMPRIALTYEKCLKTRCE